MWENLGCAFSSGIDFKRFTQSTLHSSTVSQEIGGGGGGTEKQGTGNREYGIESARPLDLVHTLIVRLRRVIICKNWRMLVMEFLDFDRCV
jgi:hypothetical protein